MQPEIITHAAICEWGRAVKTPDDLLPCLDRATRRLHVKPRTGADERPVELCDHHKDRLLKECET